MTHIDEYTIDAIIINMNYKLLDLENMEQSLNNIYLSPNLVVDSNEESDSKTLDQIINNTIKNQEEKKETEKQEAQYLNGKRKPENIKSLGYNIGIYIDKLRTNNKSEEPLNKSEEPLIINTINVKENLSKQRADMIKTVKEIYTKSEQKKKIERELYYLEYIRIILKKLKSMTENSIGISIDANEKLIKCQDLITEKKTELEKFKEETTWNPIYEKIQKYIKKATENTEIIKEANDIEKYINITDSWISSIIKENNEYERRMLIDIITQNIICSTKKSL